MALAVLGMWGSGALTDFLVAPIGTKLRDVLGWLAWLRRLRKTGMCSRRRCLPMRTIY
jgi:hypothetical protein